MFEEAPLQHPWAEFVAIANDVFGESGERLSCRFYFVGSDRSTITCSRKTICAKESRFIVDGDDNEYARQKCVHTLCKTQQLAGRIAKEFNEKLDKLNIEKTTPRASILDCLVYLIDDINVKLSVLVEDKLDHKKWHKWNSNNGYGVAKRDRILAMTIEGAVQRGEPLDGLSSRKTDYLPGANQIIANDQMKGQEAVEEVVEEKAAVVEAKEEAVASQKIRIGKE